MIILSYVMMHAAIGKGMKQMHIAYKTEPKPRHGNGRPTPKPYQII